MGLFSLLTKSTLISLSRLWGLAVAGPLFAVVWNGSLLYCFTI